MTTKTKRRATHQIRHTFYGKMFHPLDDSTTINKVKARVIPAKKPVDLVLEYDHVAKSIKLKGVGSTTSCTMAVCAGAQKDAFPHKVYPILDWTYSRAFITSKLDRNGFPSECYCYEHNDDIAKLNDTTGGQRKLAKKLKADGPMVIKLKPYRKRSDLGRPGAGRKSSGARSRLGVGAKLRYATMIAGGVPGLKV